MQLGISVCVHACVCNTDLKKKKGHEFKREQEELHGRVLREKKKGEIIYIIISKNKRILLSNVQKYEIKLCFPGSGNGQMQYNTLECRSRN